MFCDLFHVSFHLSNVSNGTQKKKSNLLNEFAHKVANKINKCDLSEVHVWKSYNGRPFKRVSDG